MDEGSEGGGLMIEGEHTVVLLERCDPNPALRPMLVPHGFMAGLCFKGARRAVSLYL